MSEKKKPRRNLKARLGKTMTAGQMPAGGLPKPGGVPAPGGNPGAVPTGGVSVRPSIPTNDPFAASAAAPAGPQEVRIVVDDDAVSQAQSGGRKVLGFAIVAALGMIIGAIAGAVYSSTAAANETLELAVQDATGIKKSLEKSRKSIEAAEKVIDELAKSTLKAVAAGKPADIKFEHFDTLRAMENPFTASEFANRNYRAFGGIGPEGMAAVQALLEYHRRVGQLYDSIEDLVKRAATEAQRTELKTALSDKSKMFAPLACLLINSPKARPKARLECALIFASASPAKLKAGKVDIQATPNDMSLTEKTLVGSSLRVNGDNAKENVVMVNKANSAAVMRVKSSPLDAVFADIQKAKELSEKTKRLRGVIEPALDKVIIAGQ